MSLSQEQIDQKRNALIMEYRQSPSEDIKLKLKKLSNLAIKLKVGQLYHYQHPDFADRFDEALERYKSVKTGQVFCQSPEFKAVERETPPAGKIRLSLKEYMEPGAQINQMTRAYDPVEIDEKADFVKMRTPPQQAVELLHGMVKAGKQVFVINEFINADVPAEHRKRGVDAQYLAAKISNDLAVILGNENSLEDRIRKMVESWCPRGTYDMVLFYAEVDPL